MPPGNDLRTNITAIRRFLRSCTARPLDDELWSTALCWNMVVPPEVRGALIAREIDDEDVLARLSFPVLVTHGPQDAIVLPSMAKHTLEHCKTAVASWYEGVGHMPFIEDAERFNRELAAFVDRARGSESRTRKSRVVQLAALPQPPGAAALRGPPLSGGRNRLPRRAAGAHPDALDRRLP